MNLVQICRSLLTILLLLFLIAIYRPPAGNAWLTPLHADITQTAFEHLSTEIQEVFRPYRQSILQAARVPDQALPGRNNHEWNIHRDSGDQTAAPAKIEALSQEILDLLRQQPMNIAEAADRLGRLSHYLADINQPLNTDDYANDNAGIHSQYEIDADKHKSALHYDPRGFNYTADIYRAAVASARRANLYYQPIIDVYSAGDDYGHLQQITNLSYQYAVSDIVNIWETLWRQATATTPSLALKINQDYFQSGDLVQITLSALPGNSPDEEADLYLVMVDADNHLWFMTPGGGFSAEVAPLYRLCKASDLAEKIIFSAPLANCNTETSFTVYGLMVTPDTSPAERNLWLSNLAEVHFMVGPLPENLLAGINDEPYLFPAAAALTGEVSGLSLQRWDFIFLGDRSDDPATLEDEAVLNRLIPGNFRHILLYLGRDSRGRPCGIELTSRNAPFLKVARFPEFGPVYPGDTALSLPVSIENIWAYKNRQAKRLRNDALKQLRAAAADVLKQFAFDLQTDILYQFEFDWSGDFFDKKVKLVDDGLANGASCTDYILSVLEESAGVCIYGSRITAAEAVDYYRFDPSGMRANIPEDWNPFPFPVTVVDILNMGYLLSNPPPHIFPCNMRNEVGVPIPAKLVNSPQFVEIKQVPLPIQYEN